MREVQANAELAVIHGAGRGAVFNDFTAGPTAARDNVLHAASCVWVGRMLAGAVPERKPSVRKIFFDTACEAVTWLEQHRGAEGQAWKRCATCRPGYHTGDERPQKVPDHPGSQTVSPVSAAAGTLPPPTAPSQAPVTDAELERLVEACRPLQVRSFAYEQHDYMTNVLLTVLDLQMHNTVVESSIRHYLDHRTEQIRTLDDLETLLARHADDQDGNREVAQYLWGNNHWMRARWLRGLARFLAEEDLRTQEALTSWARRSDYDRDFRGRVKYLGPAAYSWLVMRLGVETVKPDVYLRRFTERAVGHPVSDADLIRAVAAAARRLGHHARDLDAAIWEYERSAPGAV